MSHRSIDPRNAGFFIFLALAAALSFAAPARAQVASAPVPLPPISTMYFVRAGTFEVWQDTTRLGTEFYCSYLTGGRDSSVTSGTVLYELRQGKGSLHYEKRALRINYTAGNKVKLYQAQELIGERTRALQVTTFDTTATIFHEAESRGEAQLIAMPHMRTYMLDPSVYEQVETMIRDFSESGLESRKIQAMIPVRDTVIEIRAVRGPKEKIEGPDGKKMETRRYDLFDDLTKIQVWMDADGNLVRLEAPAQKVRLKRLPAGAEEEKAASLAKGPAFSSTAAKR